MLAPDTGVQLQTGKHTLHMLRRPISTKMPAAGTEAWLQTGKCTLHTPMRPNAIRVGTALSTCSGDLFQARSLKVHSAHAQKTYYNQDPSQLLEQRPCSRVGLYTCPGDPKQSQSCLEWKVHSVHSQKTHCNQDPWKYTLPMLRGPTAVKTLGSTLCTCSGAAWP